MPNTQKTIQIIVEAKDNASKELGNVASSIGSLGKVAGGLALGAGVAGVAALGAALVGGIGDARDANKVFAQTENVIKSTGGAAGFSAKQIQDMAGSLSAASGQSLFGDDDIERGQNMLLTFTNITTELPDATQAMLDMAQATGSDMQSSALQLGKALNDPIKGISALTRVGVSFSDQQKEQITTMTEAGDVAGAQGVILAELNKEFGGSALAAAQADGGMAQFKDSMGELGESIGQQVLPMLNALMAWLNSPDVQAAIQAVANALMTGLGAAFTWLGDVGIPAVVNGWNALMTVIGPVASFLQATLTPAFQTVIATLSQFWTEIEPKVTAAWANIQAIIESVLGVIVPFVQAHMGQIKAIMDGVWKAIQGIVEIAWGLISGIIKVGLDVLSGDWSAAWTDMKAAAATIWDGIKLALSGYVEAIKALFTIGWDVVGAAWSAVWTGLQEAAASIWTSITSAITTRVKAVKALFTAGWGDVTGAWDRLWAAIETAVTGPMQRAEDFVRGAVDNILGFIKHAIDRIGALIDAIGHVNALHVKVPAPGGGGGGGSGFQSVPSFASGVTNFGGGLAYVHAGEMLMNLSRGTSVIPAPQGSSPRVTIGDIHIHQQPGEDGAALARRIVGLIEREGIGVLRQARGRGIR